MRKFFVNSLAQSGQCQSIEDAEVMIRGVIECIEYLLPALINDRAVLLHDPRQDDKSLVPGESLHTTISKFGGKNGPDLRRKWFLYTKNRSKKLNAQTIEVTLSSAEVDPSESVKGSIEETVHHEGHFLLSFGGSRLFQSSCLQISSSKASSTHSNAYDRATLIPLLPLYEPSDKHRKEPYFDPVRKEHVAAMPLSKDEAQEVLLHGIEHAGDYWSYHQRRNTFFRFKVTLNTVYHGFEVSMLDVPLALVRKLKSP